MRSLYLSQSCIWVMPGVTSSCSLPQEKRYQPWKCISGPRWVQAPARDRAIHLLIRVHNLNNKWYTTLQGWFVAGCLLNKQLDLLWGKWWSLREFSFKYGAPVDFQVPTGLIQKQEFLYQPWSDCMCSLWDWTLEKFSKSQVIARKNSPVKRMYKNYWSLIWGLMQPVLLYMHLACIKCIARSETVAGWQAICGQERKGWRLTA